MCLVLQVHARPIIYARKQMPLNDVRGISLNSLLPLLLLGLELGRLGLELEDELAPALVCRKPAAQEHRLGQVATGEAVGHIRPAGVDRGPERPRFAVCEYGRGLHHPVPRVEEPEATIGTEPQPHPDVGELALTVVASGRAPP